MKIVLNLGAGKTALEAQTLFFQGWREIRVDIKELNPEVVDDIRELRNIPSNFADAIWACHVVEHVHWHDQKKMFTNMIRVLKDDGIAVIRVPDIGSIADRIKNGFNSELYRIGERVFTPMDIVYGHRDYFDGSDAVNYASCHKVGFTEQSLTEMLKEFGIKGFTACKNYEIMAVLYKDKRPNLEELNF